MTSEVQTTAKQRKTHTIEPEERLVQKKNALDSKHSQDSQDCDQSLIMQEIKRLDEDSSKHHVGPVMGIFFKVWSLVKVSRVRSQKIRRQNSEDASQFQYIPGDKLDPSHHSVEILRDGHFRRAGSQPAPSANRPGPLEPFTLDRATNRLQVSSAAASSTSSGVSSTSMTPPTSGPRHPGAYNIRRATAEVPISNITEPSWRSKMKRSATTLNQTEIQSWEIRRGQPSSCIPVDQPWIAAGSVERGPMEETASDDQDDDSNDIYSTPNDSIQSVPNNGGHNDKFINHQLHPITKSFSTSSFVQIQHQNRNQSTYLDKFQPIDEVSSTNHTNEEHSNKMVKRLSGSRFFISSSSSEDSNPPKQENLQPKQMNQNQLPLKLQQLSIQQGIHQHLSSIVRPDSLCTTGVAPYTTESSLASPFGLPMSPLDSMPSLSHNRIVHPSHLRPSYHWKSPLSMDLANSGSGFSSRAGKFPVALVRSSGASFKTGDPISRLPNSISLHDCKSSFPGSVTGIEQSESTVADQSRESEYKLAQMLLKSGNSNPSARDSDGSTALMHAVLSDNIPTIKCLLDHNANLDITNNEGFSALDLLCSKAPTPARLEMLKLLIDKQVDLDKTRESDGTRLLDRLISLHQYGINKLPYIDCLLQNGAKLGSSTWVAATGKHEIQLRLLKKLCQDGYFLYKKDSIEASVYRFEYALKRIAELEHQLLGNKNIRKWTAMLDQIEQPTLTALKSIKYQTYLGLSRCERKRNFFKRALEFAHMAILVDSTAYEAFYSKSHILKDLGELDDALIATEQTLRLVDKSVENIKSELNYLQQQEESLIFEGSFNILATSSPHSQWIESMRSEITTNLEYLEESRLHVVRLKHEILEIKLKANIKEDTLLAKPIAIRARQ